MVKPPENFIGVQSNDKKLESSDSLRLVYGNELKVATIISFFFSFTKIFLDTIYKKITNDESQ